MIVYENGLVVGKIDDSTMELLEPESDRLSIAIANMRREGIALLGPGTEQEDSPGDEDSDSLDFFEYSVENRGIVVFALEEMGFEVVS